MSRKLLYLLVIILISAPAFAIGAVHLSTQIVITVVACLFLVVLAILGAIRTHREMKIFTEGWFWLMLTALIWTCFQLLPLPDGLIAWLSPETNQVFQKVLGQVGLYGEGAWRPLSLAPGDTAAKIIRDIGAICFFFGIFQWARTRWHLHFIMRVSVTAASVLALMILVQTTLGMRRPLFGLYTPVRFNSEILHGSPLINLNHLGGYLLFNALLALGLVYEDRKHRRRLLWGASVLGLSLVLFLSMSRGAILSYLLGSVAFLWTLGKVYAEREERRVREEGSDGQEPRLHRGYRWGRLWRQPMLRYMVLLVLFGIGLGAHLGAEALVKEWKQTTLRERGDKLRHIRLFSEPLIKAYPMTGVGRGAMGIAWTRFTSTEISLKGQVTATHVESFVMQSLVDWGLLFGGLFLLWGLWLLWCLWRDAKGLLEHTAAIALTALIVQNLVDFNLEFAATAFPFLAVLAALRRSQHKRRKVRKKHATWWPVVLGFVSLGMLLWLAPFAWNHHYRAVPKLCQSLEGTKDNQFVPALKKVLVHHPADFVLSLYVAKHYALQRRWKPKESLLWLERTAFLNPTSASVHMLRGYILGRLGLKEEAARELGRAAKLYPERLQDIVRTIQRYDLTEVSVRVADSPLLVRYLLHLMRQRRVDAEKMESFTKIALQRFPRYLQIYYTTALFYLQELRGALRAKDTERVKALQQKLSTLLEEMKKRCNDPNAMFALLQGRLAMTLGQEQRAISYMKRVLERFAWRSSGRWEALYSLFLLYTKAEDWSGSQQVLMQMRSQYTSITKQAQVSFFHGQWWEARGKLRYALPYFNEARRLWARADYIAKVAQIHAKLGEFSQSITLYRRLSKKRGYGWAKQRIQQLRIKQQKRDRPLP